MNNKKKTKETERGNTPKDSRNSTYINRAIRDLDSEKHFARMRIFTIQEKIAYLKKLDLTLRKKQNHSTEPSVKKNQRGATSPPKRGGDGVGVGGAVISRRSK
jgi:hypothetical protein